MKEESNNWFNVGKHEGNNTVKGNWIVCYCQTLLTSRKRMKKKRLSVINKQLKAKSEISKPSWQQIKRVSSPQRECRET